MRTIALQFTGHRGMGGEKIFKSDEGIHFMEDMGNIVYIGKEIDADPYGSVENIDKYKDTNFILTGHEDEPTEKERFNYMMLSRLEQDCKYYLGNGGRHESILWAENVKDHITEMKTIYNRFTDDKKPEWLTWEQIEKYEVLMK